jgi:hypothetical protein
MNQVSERPTIKNLDKSNEQQRYETTLELYLDFSRQCKESEDKKTVIKDFSNTLGKDVFGKLVYDHEARLFVEFVTLFQELGYNLNMIFLNLTQSPKYGLIAKNYRLVLNYLTPEFTAKIDQILGGAGYDLDLLSKGVLVRE